MKTVTTMVLLLALACTATARAQEAAPLTLRAAIDTALMTHPALELASASVARARSGVREARAARMPSLSADGQLTQFEKPMIVAPIHALDFSDPPAFDNTLMQGSLSLNYALFDAARGARIERARALESATATTESAARMQVIADVARAWLRLRSARETALAHDQRLIALAQERARAVQLVEQGRAARVVLMRAEAALSSARADSIAGASSVADAASELARQMGVPAERVRSARLPADNAAPAAAPDAAVLREQARHAPELTRLARQIEAAQALQSEARGLWLPRVLAGGRYVEYAAADVSPQGEWQAGVQFSYALTTGGTRQAANDRAGAELRAARAELEIATRRVDDAIDRALSAYTTARGRVSALEAGVTQSAEVARIEKLALDAGAGVQSDYLSAESELFRARAALTEARTQMLLALVELARLGGQLTEQWIADNVEPR